MTAREDFRAAVRKAATYPGQSFAAIDRAGDEYASAALLSLAAAFDDMAGGMRRDVTGSAFRYAANMARERAGNTSPKGSAP